MKQLLIVIEENRRYIETERAKVTLDLKNTAEITNWENRIKTDNTAIVKFYASCIKLRESQKLKLLTRNEEKSSVSIEKKLTKHKLDEQNAENGKEESKFEFRTKEREIEERRPKIKKRKNNQ
jgi:hypothetical protein